MKTLRGTTADLPASDTVMTTDSYMQTILTRVGCKKHNAGEGVPCWFVIPDAPKFGLLFGACGSRTRKAGFVGTSTQDSLKVKSVRRFKK